MSKQEKLLARFCSTPADFTWEELVKLLNGLGYERDDKGRTSGSRVRFSKAHCAPINLHKPHPSNVMKRYQLRQIQEFLQAEQLLPLRKGA